MKHFLTTILLWGCKRLNQKHTPYIYILYLHSTPTYFLHWNMDDFICSIFFNYVFLNDENKDVYINRLFKSIIHSYLDPFSFNHRFSKSFSTIYRKSQTKYCLGFSQTTNDFVTIESPKYLVQFSFLHVWYH